MVREDLTRKAVNLTWLDPDTGENPLKGDFVDISATNPDKPDDEPSTRNGLTNDGYAVYTFPGDYHGTAHFVVSDDEGSVEGDIAV